jgi:multiple sugar transport system permease protein
MAIDTAPTTAGRTGTPRTRPSGRGRAIRGQDNVAGWLFLAPAVIVLGLFLVLPIFMAAWVSVSDWTGSGSPLSGRVGFVGADHYTALLTEPGLARQNFGTSIRNNLYFVLLVVPTQTAAALLLANVLHQRKLAGRSFFLTTYYFPTVTSSVAIAVVFLFMFSSTGSINAILGLLGIEGPSWFADARGVLHLLLGSIGIDAPTVLAGNQFLGISWWEWLAGPSVAMCAIIMLVIWTSTGGFMLMFYAALQNLPESVFEAAVIDGANRFQRFFQVTVPMLRPTLFLVLTLGLIGTWQVFDQIYILGKGAPGGTTLTPAFLSYFVSFTGGEWGQGSAIAFILFFLIVALTLLQRWLLRDKGAR